MEPQLHNFLKYCPVARVKGILQTDKGCVFVNRMADDWEWQIAPLETAKHWQQSRLEMLSDTPQSWSQLENQLCACVTAQA